MPSDLLFPLPGSTARLSEDGVYRYELARRWSNGPTACWIMLNPSTADATLDDPTTRRVRRFSRDWGLGAFRVVNLFAFRATDPRQLVQTRLDRVGAENDDVIHDAVVGSRVVVVAWGNPPHSTLYAAVYFRALAVLELLQHLGRDPLCLGQTKRGWPRHPVRLPASVQPMPYKMGR